MYTLPPIINSLPRDLLTDKGFIFPLVDALGSPLHLILPQEFEDNISLFQNVFTRWGVEARIWYAYKVNKAQALIEVLACHNVGVDVSSIVELRHALGHGVPGHRIGISGPIKDERLLLLAMQHQCTITLDDLGELKIIDQLSRNFELTNKVNILIRLSGFEITTQDRSEPAFPRLENGRFGITVSDIPVLFSHLQQDSIKSSVNLLGFSFHIDNHSVRDRGEAIAVVIKQILKARSLGFPCNEIDLGGGFSVKYIEEGDWNNFLDEYALSIQRKKPPIMFRNKNFGLVLENGKRTNRGNFYPHVNETKTYKDGFLDSIMSYRPSGQNRSISETLKENNIRVTIEPGKSLVDQVGITLCRVRGIKKSSGGDQFLLCDMNFSHLFEQVIGSEYAVDPILILNPDSKPRQSEEFLCHIAGNSCLESDILAWRKIKFNHMPVKGDLLAFINTAGYQMDFLESKIHQMPLPKKIITYKKKNVWNWKTDELFSAIDTVSNLS